LEDGAEKDRRATEIQTQVADTSKQAADSGCPADVNEVAAISITASVSRGQTRKVLGVAGGNRQCYTLQIKRKSPLLV
jgi:hypothetical protein